MKQIVTVEISQVREPQIQCVDARRVFARVHSLQFIVSLSRHHCSTPRRRQTVRRPMIAHPLIKTWSSIFAARCRV